MPTYKKISGKHFYRNENGELQCVKEGETITCSPKFLGSAISTFKRIKNDDSGSEKEGEIEERTSEEVEKPKKKAKKENSEKEAVKTFKRKTEKED